MNAAAPTAAKRGPGFRWASGIGIVVGGIGGAVAALMGAPKEAPVVAPAPVASAATPVPAFEPTLAASPASAPPADSAPAPASPPVSAAPAATPAPATAPALDTPTTREALLRAEMLCDQKKDFDECARAAQALETGSAGPADADGAKRFRKIALTHLVMQCETGNSPHACYVLAGKYRTGGEVAQNTVGADALEKRAGELCKFRAAPECPPQ